VASSSVGQLAASVAVEPLDGRLDIVVDVFEDVSTGAEPLLFGLEFGRGERLLALLIDLAIDLGEPLFADALGIGLRLSDDLVRPDSAASRISSARARASSRTSSTTVSKLIGVKGSTA